MRFPEKTRVGSEPHADAVRRLDEARDHQRLMHDAHEASKDTGSELSAATDLSAAEEKAAAREAWVAWVERDY